ncbi:SNF2 family N-terminal domain-containing protein [Whalleya microplaca]|nr:SNF2 family N-terminal domain-containing protein [Whalleya microplaca]
MAPPRFHPELSASPDQPISDARERKLREDLRTEHIYLESLQGTPENTPARRANFIRNIQDIQAKLDKHLRDRQSTTSDPSPRAPASAMFDYNDRPQARSRNTYGSNPSRAGMNMLGPRQDTSSTRKRTFSTHIGASPPSAPSKSRRTTPSPLMNAFSTPPDDAFDETQVIDLTGDDWRKNQKEAFFSFDEKRRREDEDAEMARRLHAEMNESGPRSSPSPFSVPSGPGGFNSSYSGLPLSHRPINSPNRNGSAGPSTPQHTLHSPSIPRAGSSSTLPSHLKSQSPVARFSDLPASNNSGQYMAPASSSASGRYSMPGSYDSDNDDLFGEDSRLSEPETTYQSFPRDPSRIGSHATEHAQQAALRQQQQQQQQHHQQYNTDINFLQQHGFPAPTSSSSSLPLPYSANRFGTSEPRPGMLLNGTSNYFGSLSSTPVYNGRQNTRKSLNDIIASTAGYDYDNGIDRSGNPLPQHLRNVMSDMEDTGSSEEEIRQLLASIRPDTELTSEDRDNTPEQLRYPLYKHQQLALQWMQQMEQDRLKKGGILADDMGLGKTISSLALMVSRQAKRPTVPGQRFIKTNLIVGPVSLVRQWHREIQTKIKPQFGLSVLMLHGKKYNYEQIRNHDVVLTTYGTLSSEYKRMDKYIRDAKTGGWHVDNADLNRNFPLLGPDCIFYRVFLDEAQYIKTATTLAAKATSSLRAEYRWLLTGTPMMNNVSELASLIHFLRIKPYCDPNVFKKEFGVLSKKNKQGGPSSIKPEAMGRLRALLKAVMLRRSKNSLLDGKPIVNLPEKTEVVDHVIMKEDERKYYEDLKENARVQVSKYLKAGTVGKHYSAILVLLLRLRQACCHPYLHLTDLEFVNSEITEEAMVEIARSLSLDVVRRIKEADGFDCPICLDAVANPTIVFPCGHCICPECFNSFQQGAMQRNIQAGQDGTDMQCPQCRGVMKSEKIISYEIFKKVHMPEQVEQELSLEIDDTESDTDYDSDSESEDSGDDVDDRGNLKGFIVDDEEETSEKGANKDGLNLDDIDQDFRDNLQNSRSANGASSPDDADGSSDLEDIAQVFERASKKTTGRKTKTKTKTKTKRVKSKGKGKEKEEEIEPHMLQQLRKAAIKSSKAHKRYMRYLRKIWLPSAKVTKCTELLSKIQSTGEKTIIFSQWTILLDLLEIPIKRDLNLGYRRYEGGMSAIQRDSAARDFMEKPDVKVILVSLKAGNAGLNLTTASQVIIMDPFWNPYVEMQAVDRAYRIGQLRPVTVHRILIKDTVEDKIMSLQEEKRQLVESALDESAAANIGRLDDRHLAELFGISR